MLKNICLILICFSSLAIAQSKDFKTLTNAAEFRKKYIAASGNIQTIKADFIQEKNITVLSEKIISKGEFIFKKQDKLKMEYHTPFKYLMVINKDKVMIKDEQKTNTFSSSNNKLFENINKIMIDCIQGTAMDNKNFKFKVYESNAQYLLSLTPQKKEMQEFFSTINIYIEKKDYSVDKVEMQEASGDNTIITFVNKHFNTNIPDEVFAIH